MLTLNQYILLDPILLFFISGATYTMSKFRNLSNEEFSTKWWFWLSLSGIFIGCAFSVKFVGLFVILLVGINTIAQLWDIMGDVSKPFFHTIKHFAARAICLILLPIVLYITFFYIHLTVLYKS
jgi:dolichyl-phosphate-mannose-protein mannosyltransferase